MTYDPRTDRLHLERAARLRSIAFRRVIGRLTRLGRGAAVR